MKSTPSFYQLLLLPIVFVGVLVVYLFMPLHLSAQSSLPQTDLIAPLARSPQLETILDGQPADPGEWPWQVVVLVGPYFCAGTLIDDQWVVTAAHCLFDTKNQPYGPTAVQVILGEYDLDADDGSEQVVTVDLLFPHPNYNPFTFNNDIALVHLATPAIASPAIAAAPLLSAEEEVELLAQGQLVTVIGWGVTNEKGSLSSTLMEVTVPIVDRDICRQSYSTLTNNMICAGYPEGGKDACHGDSGGPLLTPDNKGKWKVAGIVSFGNGCGRPKYYGVYTRVSQYHTWIEEVIAAETVEPTPLVLPTATIALSQGTPTVPTVTLAATPSPAATIPAAATPSPTVTTEQHAYDTSQLFLPIVRR